MSLDFAGWLAGGNSLLRQQIPLLAAIEQGYINDKPTAVVLMRGNAKLPSQQVRIEYQDWATGDASESGMSDIRRLVVFGIQGHPTLPNTNIREGDTFILDHKEYTVISVNKQLHGQVQAHCEAVS